MPNLQLPAERIAQLHLLAGARSLTIADLIGDLVNREIAEGTIPADIPTLGVKRTGERVRIDAGAFVKELPVRDAAKFADDLHAFLTPGASNPFLVSPKAGPLTAMRRGKGVMVRDPGTGAERVFALSIARDLARNISLAAL